MTYSEISIAPGSSEALTLTAEDLRVMYYTGRSRSQGYGRDKTTTYRSGIQTRLGDIEQSQWQALMKDIIRRNGEESLFAALTDWELENTPWIHKRAEAEQRALEAFAEHWFDNPTHRDYIAFNQKHRPELLPNHNET